MLTVSLLIEVGCAHCWVDAPVLGCSGTWLNIQVVGWLCWWLVVLVAGEVWLAVMAIE